MAVNPKDLTVDYREIQSMPFRDRKALMYSGYADQVNAALTPSQRANLFPSYYRNSADSAMSGSGGGAGGGGAGVENLSKAEYLKRARSGGVSNSDLNRVSGTPDKKGPPEITASKFHAVESNPFLAGYVDKAGRKENLKIGPGQQKLLGLIASGEGGYNSSNGGTLRGNIIGSTHNTQREGKPLTDLTVAEVEKYMSLPLGDPNRLFAVGKYQLTKTGAWPGAVKFLGLKPTDKITPEIQEKMGLYAVMEKRPEVGRYIRGESDDLLSAQKALALEFASIPVPTDMTVQGNFRPAGASAYGSGNRAGHSIDSVKEALINAKNDHLTQSSESVAEQTTPSPDAMAVVQQVASETPMASELQPTATEVTDVTKDSTVSSVVDDYLWEKYQKTAPYKNADGYKSDQKAAEAAGLSLKDFVIGGADKDFKVNLYTAGQSMDKDGVPWGINSMYRDDYRNKLAYGGESGHHSHHGTSDLGYTYGTGKAVDITSTGDVDREVVYKWIDEKGGGFGVARPYAMGAGKHGRPDAPHVGPLSSSEMHRLPFRKGYTSGKYVMEQAQQAGGYSNIVEKQKKIIADQIEEKQNQLAATAQPVTTASQTGTPIPATTSGSESVASTAGTSTPTAGATTSAASTATTTSGPTTPNATTASTPAGATTPNATTASTPAGATTPNVTTSSMPTTPESATHPTKTMAQGGIIPKSADTQIVQKNMSGDIVSATKVSENENEKMSIEPISKMNADSLTKGSSNPVEENMINNKSQAASEEKKVSMQRQSSAAPRLSSDPYSNINAEIKPMSPTAQAAMNRARDLSSDRRGYSIKQ